jgi:RteC protein
LKKHEEILKKLDASLEVLESDSKDILQKAEQGIKLTKQVLEQLRDLVVDQSFKKVSSEINFFRNVKPQVYSKLIYYVKLFNIESKRPRSSNKSQIKYLNRHIDKLQNYFNDNLEFYHYYRRNATTLDEQYFIRGKADIRLYPDTFHFFTDKQFSTSHDLTVATILAYDMLIIHLKKEIDKLENNNSMETINSPNPILSSKLF